MNIGPAMHRRSTLSTQQDLAEVGWRVSLKHSKLPLLAGL